MRLLVQPEAGVRPLIKAIAGARRTIEIVIFRFDQREIERALANAVSRGVAVHALIAHTNRAGEENLRRLEMRLLGAGVTVARTADDLARYHGKLMIVDRRDLYLLAFNLTHADIEHTRSFGVVTRRPALVREAGHLFEADMKRHPYEPASDSLVVSPVNARRLLAGFIQGAKKELLIYDPKVSDRAMTRLLEDRAAAGVDIRMIGRLTRGVPGMRVCKPAPVRLHARAMIRDGQTAFVGSQSLRAMELDERREVGLIFRIPKVVAQMRQTFLDDWSRAEEVAQHPVDHAPAARVAKKIAKLLAKDLPPVTPALSGAVREIVGDGVDVELDSEEVEAVIKGAVKTAVKEVVSDMVEEVVEEQSGGAG
jgi:phosphatidylserine/phosphatidylglycerophosphate/cardiolipin synthase-like enzyme